MPTSIERVGDKVMLSTDRLVLRPAQEGDSEALHKVFCDPAVMQYWSELPHISIQRTNEWISDMVDGHQNGTTDFIITLKQDGKATAIGKMGIWQENEIGFLLGKQYWRRGLAREALEALLPYYFNDRGFRTITADVDPENAACLGLLKKIGFEVFAFEKETFQLGERWVDSCYLRLTKEWWEILSQT